MAEALPCGRAYVNSPRGATLRGDAPQLSSLYFRYEPDFGGGEAGIVAHLRRFAAPELNQRLAKTEHIGDRGFDWTLNDAGLTPKPEE